MRILGLLRILALITVVAGAAGSIYLMFRVGKGAPLFLTVLFTGWVLAPFIALAVAGIASKPWSVPVRATLYGVMLVLTPVSLWIYANPTAKQPAFVFLAIPSASWVLMVIAVATAAFKSRR